jgi:hypothetical protein
MSHLLFFVAAIAASLFWTAACIAAAARTARRRPKQLLVTAGVIVPPLILLPWVVLAAWLAFGMGLRTNWFAPTLTAFLSAVIGGWWIRRAGLARSADGDGCVAEAWPAFGLAALFLAAEAASFGTLLGIDRGVVAAGRALRVEAAQLMAASLPPTPAPDDDAAPLYERAFAELAAERLHFANSSPQAKLLSNWRTADVAAADVAALLARHAATLDLVRRAAAKPGCRFVRDWSRPSVDMLLPEFSSMRQAARLLALAARRESASGAADAALRDVVLLGRLATHAGADPLLIAGVVSSAIDGGALETLAAVLPATKAEDLARLADPAFTDFLGTTVSFRRHLFGEEAWGLATAADLADGAWGMLTYAGDEADGFTAMATVAGPLASVYRCFLWPAEVVGYKRCLHGYQQLLADPTDRLFPATQERIAAIERQLLPGGREVMLGPLLVPALGGCFKAQCSNQALHRCAEVLVAITRARLATGSLPEAVAAFVPDQLPALPIDPFTADAPLRAKFVEHGWIVYSVGPDGEDDGGPPAPGDEPAPENDDVGLHMAATSDR